MLFGNLFENITLRKSEQYPKLAPQSRHSLAREYNFLITARFHSPYQWMRCSTNELTLIPNQLKYTLINDYPFGLMDLK